MSNAFLRSINTHTVGRPLSIFCRQESVSLNGIDNVDFFFLKPAWHLERILRFSMCFSKALYIIFSRILEMKGRTDIGL